MTNTSAAQLTLEGASPAGSRELLTLSSFNSHLTAPGSAVRGLYLHVPFCFHKCHYCDFYSIVDSRERQPAFTQRLTQEIEAVAAWLTCPIETVFVGGGTPTLLSPTCWERILQSLRSNIRFADSLEFTVEANPETLTQQLMQTLTSGGVNRISIGAQSFNLDHLKTLERHHDPQNVHRAVMLARQAGIENINIDLIFGIPGQSLEDWRDDLQQTIDLGPMHVSCYGLMYEPNTPLTKKLQMGAIERIDEDLEAAMYEVTIDALADAGYEHYEISNWARAGRRCAHNLLYWRNRHWLGLGPSASGHVNGLRWKNVPRLADYLKHTPLPPIQDVEQVDRATAIGELFMLGLRLLEGMPTSTVDALLQDDCDRSSDRRAAIERHLQQNLLEIVDDQLRLTRRGLLLADAVLSDLV